MSFMPSPRSLVLLKSGELAWIVKVTPKGDDDQVAVIREYWGKPMLKKVRITVDQIEEIVYEHGN